MKNKLIIFILCLFPATFFAQSIELDIELGKQNAEMVEAQMGIYDDDEKTAYIRKVGEKLIAQLDNPLFEYDFHLVPDMSPNAFALPGGHLYVTTGLIPILESEDELACIMGHEIIHSNNRHSIQQLKKSIVPRLLEIPGNLLGAINKDLGDLFNAPIQTSNALLKASYGRKYETEADDEGIALAAKAGYNPKAMVTALTRLSKSIEVATNNKEEKSYFNDHPYTPDRTQHIEEQINAISIAPNKPVSQSFLKEFDDVLFGKSPSQGVIDETKFLHPDLNFMVEFPEKWDIDNQPTNVGAYAPDRKAGAFVSLDDSKLSPKQAATNFIDNLEDDYKSKMISSDVYELNGNKGYMVSFKETMKGQTMYAYLAWIPMDGKLFKLIGIAPMEFKPTLDKTAASLRVLTNKEKNSFVINKMRVVEAKNGETIEVLSKRVGNRLNIDLTCTINDIDTTTRLKNRDLIKVVLQEQYKNN